MTSETPNLHVSKNLNISKTKQDIEKLKTPLRLVWKCCSVVFRIGSKIFSLQWHFKRWTASLLGSVGTQPGIQTFSQLTWTFFPKEAGGGCKMVSML